MSYRILIAEFAHETNRFSQRPTRLQSFRERCLLVGGRVPEVLKDTNTEIAGFIDAADQEGWEIVLPIAASAGPSGLVSIEAEAMVTDAILTSLSNDGPFDGLLLALHGAMVTETADDGEGALLAKLREKVGPKIPIIVTLDLHANVTDDMAALASALISYRTYPHVDLRERGQEAGVMMAQTLAGEVRPVTAVARLPMLKGCDDGRTTGGGPMPDLLAEARRIEREEPGVLSVSINSGFADADIHDAGPSVTVTGDGDSPRWGELAAGLMAEIWRRRDEESVVIVSPEEAVENAKALGPGTPAVVIADYADNPGAGAYGDATRLLGLMLEAGLENAAFGGLYDPEAAKELAEAGVGAELTLALGGKTDPRLGGGPLTLTGKVNSITNGRFTYEGPMFTGTSGNIGKSVAFQVGGIEILVISNNAQMLDRGLFRVAEIVPETKAFLGVKSMQHFLGAFGPIAREVIVCDSGALCSADLTTRPFQHLRRPIYPLDPVEV